MLARTAVRTAIAGITLLLPLVAVAPSASAATVAPAQVTITYDASQASEYADAIAQGIAIWNEQLENVQIDEVEPPHRLVFRDGFANEDGTQNTELPMTTARVTIEAVGSGKTRMSIESEFPTAEAMEQLAAMGMEEGLKQAVGQIDAILAEVEAGGGQPR